MKNIELSARGAHLNNCKCEACNLNPLTESKICDPDTATLPLERCNVCKQQTIGPSAAAHHLEKSPVDYGLCLGCWMASVDFELWYLRATGESLFSLTMQDVMRGMLDLVKQKKAELRIAFDAQAKK